MVMIWWLRVLGVRGKVGAQEENAGGYAHARGASGRGIKYLGFAPLNARIHGEMVVVC